MPCKPRVSANSWKKDECDPLVVSVKVVRKSYVGAAGIADSGIRYLQKNYGYVRLRIIPNRKHPDRCTILPHTRMIPHQFVSAFLYAFTDDYQYNTAVPVPSAVFLVSRLSSSEN